MPLLGIGLHIGDSDPDSIVGPVINGVLRSELGEYLRTEAGEYLAFD